MPIYFNRDHLLQAIEYPNRYRRENLLKTAAVIFGAILVFLLLFKPFGVYAPEEKMNYFLICGMHALSPALIVYLYFSAINYLRVKGSALKSWTLLQEYIQLAAVLLLMGLASFLMRDLIYQNANNWSWYYLWEELKNCFTAGVLIYFFFRLVIFYFQPKKESSSVFQWVPLRSEPETEVADAPVFIKTQVKQDDFSLNLNDLLFVKAEGNYIELTTCTDKQVHTELKRISLTQFELQISAHHHFFRCHRAYLVNMLRVEKVSGNAQGYLLAFNNTPIKVPVSRSQLVAFNSAYQQLRLA